MGTSRRGFIQVAGLGVLGFALAKPATSLFSRVQSSGTSTASELLSTAGTTQQKRYAMAIDLEACKKRDGCTVCSEACHVWHNVPDIDNREEEIKWIWTDHFERVFEDHVTEFINHDKADWPVVLLCNQCTTPFCVKYCPTRATWKRPEDGIIMVDYHRCIGCRYCMAGCPYGARSFNWKDPLPYIKEINEEYPHRTRGVVEKCNFCADRLDKGLQPACVEACPEKALTFGDINDPNSPGGEEVREILRTHHILRRMPELGTEPNNYYF